MQSVAKRWSLGTISRNRNILFGIAILGIMLFHSPLVIPERMRALSLLKIYGSSGVDIFFFLSAMGLYYSMEKDPDIFRFYKKRFVRILLPTILVLAIYFSFASSGVNSAIEYAGQIILNIIWIPSFSIEWFVAAVIYFYLIYPLIYRMLKKNRNQIWIWIGLSFILIFVLKHFVPIVYQSRFEVFLTRIPVILLGCWFAPYIKEDRELPRFTKYAAVFLIVFSFLSVYFSWNIITTPWTRYVFIPSTVGVILTVCWICDSLKGNRAVLFAMKVFSWIGGYTLELYLVHEKILHFSYQMNLATDAHELIRTVFAIVLAVPVAVALKKFCDLMVREIKNM